ncbi:MAG: DUF3089 domain-containing protein [bacterium]|nr:DUF3089 domain-containing protein [bacterium]MDP6076516.1 DUF3089 domain-containing protein [Myxococcota bacterium]MDP6242194.1 DUF3089 domain-containing protein [Myxococcota bacterium]MDP7297924.1 DUF3089 domain-containing protein [Myxococcota bacterium]HJO22800.1 DUF3089 domain-containing protein [Myxococcota bacterium]
MRRPLTRRTGSLVLLLWVASGGAGCSSLGHWVMTPPGAFDAADAPPAPDYALPSNWAALSGEPSRADAVPPNDGVAVDPAEAAADAFFLHPTTYFWRTHWSAPIGGWLTKVITGATLAGQASAFNGTARIYAPRYRQMTLAGFELADGRDAALALAYGDVRRAFLYYLETWADDRPLILAGHSQGSRHLRRLLEEFFASGPLRERLVAAYLVGMPVWHREKEPVPVCATPEQTGCMVAWRSFATGADPKAAIDPENRVQGDTICVNPISWIPGGSAPAPENLGSIPLPMIRGPADLVPGYTGARCGAGVLWVDPPPRRGFRLAHPQGDWHAYDYALFYADVRANAEKRVDAFLNK